MPFAFYDLETTGTSPAFDQPLQFAAILTDDDLQELDRLNIRCRLAPHILPSPLAMAITQITPEKLTDPSLPSWFEFAKSLRQQIETWAPACWTGYNSIRFDEEVLRQTFYQNLQPEIYLTQLNGNRRMDVLRAVQSIRMLKPDIMIWPEVAGAVSYKLERLAPANGFPDHDAHDALGDVLATMHLARIIRDRAPSIWCKLLANRDKNDVISRLRTGRPMKLVENHFGRLKVRYGCYCGVQDNYPSAVAFYDLDTDDPADLLDADDEMISASMTGEKRRIHIIATNRDPSLFDYDDPPRETVQRASSIASRSDFHRRVGAIMGTRYRDLEKPEQVEQQIYSGFLTPTDKAVLSRFQQSDPEAWVKLLEEMSDNRMQRLGRRILLSEAPNLFPYDYLRRASRSLAERWNSAPEHRSWNTAEQVHLDLHRVEAEGLATQGQVQQMRTFFIDRISRAETGRTFLL